MLFIQQLDIDLKNINFSTNVQLRKDNLKGFNSQTSFQEGRRLHFVTFSGDKPVLSATPVIQVSVTSADWGKPNPRNAVFDGKFVLQA